ncbi:MAG: hypothetical protein JKY49_04245 [Cohaesibacteraceae bacterium]|nr:hypothetical protein [Cohaesibacteraceae bacterium]MBL4876404.1 hypothetical protein [Cohaesibacteraceae bacterium]
MGKGPFKRLGIFFVCFSLFVGVLYLKEASATGALQSPCSTRSKMVELLSNRYQEAKTAMGLISNRGVIELYVSASGSWTMLITSSNGKACILAAGKYWQTTIAVPEGAPA